MVIAIIAPADDYTREAKAFAEAKPIGLIDGKGLLELVERVRTRPPQQTESKPERREPTPWP